MTTKTPKPQETLHIKARQSAIRVPEPDMRQNDSVNPGWLLVLSVPGHDYLISIRIWGMSVMT